MLTRGSLARFAIALLLGLIGVPTRADAASSCVWKVTAQNGATVYLGGSIHALRRTDYPLPLAFKRAFDASERIVFEVSDSGGNNSNRNLMKAGAYPRGDNLRNHVDPRTYSYVRHLFSLMRVPEAEFSRYRPWFIVLGLQSPNSRGFSAGLGVDEFLLKRARANRKPVSGLESIQEHVAVFSGLTERESEFLLLFTLLPQGRAKGEGMPWLQAWRNGDADRIAAMMREEYRDFPAFGERLLGMRNQRWVPKIERYLQSGHTYFVVAGAGHFGGPDGVLALLRARGYQIAQM